MKTVTVELTAQELGLLKAGLAAHRIALEPYLKNPADRANQDAAVEQKYASLDLSDKLTTAQIALLEA